MTTPDTLSALTDHIIASYHDPLRIALPELLAMNKKVREVHGDMHPEFEKILSVLSDFSEEMTEHLRKEETILFPIMRKIDQAFQHKEKLEGFHCGSVTNPIRQMEAEHTDFEAMLQKIREYSHNYLVPTDACKTYRAFYEKLQWLEKETIEHATLENTKLHTLAKKRELECYT